MPDFRTITAADWRRTIAAARSQPNLVLMKLKEKLLMAHRYLYYVECAPVISDYVYDTMEKEISSSLSPDSPLFKVGSDLAEDYSEDVRRIAANLKLAYGRAVVSGSDQDNSKSGTV